MLYLFLAADGLATGCAIGLVAVTFAYFYSTTGTFHVAHAGVYTFSGYVAWFLVGLGVPFVAAFALAILGGAALGVTIQVLLYARLERNGATPLVLLIAAIGALTVLQNVAAILFTPNIVQFALPWRTDHVQFGVISFSIPQTLILVLCPLLFVGLVVFSNHTFLGKKIRAVASNAELAEITHLNPGRVVVCVMAISSALVAVPGVLVGVDQALQPYNSLVILLTAVVAVIAGGIGSLTGAFFMSILLAIVQSVSVAFVSGRWSVAVVFAIFIFFILVRPEGLIRRKFSRAI